MKITIELTNLDEVKAVVAALESRNTQSVMALAPVEPAKSTVQEIKEEIAKAEPKATKTKASKVKAAAVEVQAEQVETVADETGAEPSEVEPREGDIDDATIREIGGKLLREMNARGKDGVSELTKILASLSSKKVIEIPMNLRPRFMAKVNEALA